MIMGSIKHIIKINLPVPFLPFETVATKKFQISWVVHIFYTHSIFLSTAWL